MEKCPNLGEAVLDTVVLTIDLVGYQAKNAPDLAQKVLNDGKVKAEIEKRLMAVAKDFLKKQQNGGTIGSSAAAKQLLDQVAKPVGQTAMKQAEKEVKSSKQYKRLAQGVETLKCSWRATPTGAWVDENKKVLIIVAAGMAVGGAAAMYTTKTGDGLADIATKLAGKKVASFKLGAFDFSVGSLKFKPSERQVGGSLTIETKGLKKIQASLTLSAVATGTKLTGATAKGKAVVPLSRSTALKVLGTADPYQNLHNLSLTVSHSKNGLSVGVAAILDVERGMATGSLAPTLKYKKGPVSIGAQYKGGVVGHNRGGHAVQGLLSFDL